MLYNLHTHTQSGNPDTTEIVNVYPYQSIEGIKNFSTGIHPWYIDEGVLNSHFAIIEKRLQLYGCLALGECGLDKRIETDFDLQTQILERQLLLAQSYNKPVILHCVAAYDEVIALKNKLNITVPMILHGFSKNSQIARQLLKQGFYLSFGKYLLHNEDLSDVLADVPHDRFFLETDTIDESIEQVYQKAAEAKGTDVQEIEDIVSTNFKTVFKNG